MKKTDQNKKLFLEQLQKTPVVEIACQKINISRMTFYRWKADDKEFAKEADEAVRDGQKLVNDLAESQLIGAVKDRNLPAIMYWLRNHHPDYANKLRIEHALDDEELTPEQEAVVREALRLAAFSPVETNQELYEQPTDKPGVNGSDDQGQASESVDN
jgi:hypothetical protein